MIDYVFKNQALLEEALTHRSFAHEGLSTRHNERLEFLGDAVIGLIMSDQLLAHFPEANEGELSKRRATLVNESSLAEVARTLEIGPHLRLGKGESSSGGQFKPRLLASALEALVGAIYLDAGFVTVKDIVCTWFVSHANLEAEPPVSDFKSALQEKVQERTRSLPKYELRAESGPAHDRWFLVAVVADGVELAVGEGRSKKAAEQEAARKALEHYQ